VEVLKRNIDAVRRKRGELWRDRSLILHHDKAPTHSCLRVSQVLTGKASRPWMIWLQLASGYFQNSKSVLKGKHFSDIEDIKSSVEKKN
jgi:hypothetical protein